MTPKTIDCELVMTAAQLNVPPPVGQPARWLPLKWAYVSYAEIARPITASTMEVTWSHSGCSEGRGGCCTGTSATGSVAAALGAGRVALELVGVAETAAAVLADRPDAGPAAGLAAWPDAGRRFELAFEFAITTPLAGGRPPCTPRHGRASPPHIPPTGISAEIAEAPRCGTG